MKAVAICLFLAVSLLANSRAGADKNLVSRSQMTADYTKVFKSWDKDGDGRISKAELRAVDDAFMALAHFSSDADAKQFREDLMAIDAAWDVNGDG